MDTKFLSLLQLFSEGGAEGSGESAADAGQHLSAAQPEIQAAAAKAPDRMTWEQIKADPEYSARMRTMVQQRVKNSRQAQEAMDTLRPALEILAKQHGICGDAPDYGALAQAVMQAPEKKEAQLRQHYRSLVEEGRALQAKYPDFQLHKELENPLFAKLTAPGVGVSLEDAYYTVHRQQIQGAALQVAARETALRISNTIRAGGGRPEENGTSSLGPSVSSFDYRTASREQREALKTRIRLAGAKGEKIYPGRL